MMFLPLEETKRMQAERLRAVKRAYWQATPVKAYEVWKMQTALAIAQIVDAPTIAQAESVFMILPKHVFGDGLKHGFNDHSVEKDLYEFLINHRSTVIEMLATAAPQDAARPSEYPALQIVGKT